MAEIQFPALIIFIKNPVLSRVKTRLAKTMGDETALAIYEHLLSVCNGVTKDFQGQKYVYYSDEIDNDDLWNNSVYHKRVQFGKTLGERMFNAFSEVLQLHSGALIIGSDCPYLNLQHLADACNGLQNSDFVLGPTRDGGYYLLGMNDLCPEVFNSIQWSHSSVFETTLKRISDSGLSYELLEMLEDIDTQEDWERYRIVMGRY